MSKITITLGEYDLEMFKDNVVYGNETITWSYETEEGETISVEFINEEEESQREQ